MRDIPVMPPGGAALYGKSPRTYGWGIGGYACGEVLPAPILFPIDKYKTSIWAMPVVRKASSPDIHLSLHSRSTTLVSTLLFYSTSTWLLLRRSFLWLRFFQQMVQHVISATSICHHLCHPHLPHRLQTYHMWLSVSALKITLAPEVLTIVLTIVLAVMCRSNRYSIETFLITKNHELEMLVLWPSFLIPPASLGTLVSSTQSLEMLIGNGTIHKLIKPV
jgi:hypothetical protein